MFTSLVTSLPIKRLLTTTSHLLRDESLLQHPLVTPEPAALEQQLAALGLQQLTQHQLLDLVGARGEVDHADPSQDGRVDACGAEAGKGNDMVLSPLDISTEQGLSESWTPLTAAKELDGQTGAEEQAEARVGRTEALLRARERTRSRAPQSGQKSRVRRRSLHAGQQDPQA